MADIAKAKVPVEFDKAQIAADAEASIGPAIAGAATNGLKLLAGLEVGRKIADVGKAGFDELIERQTVAAQTSVALRGQTDITAESIEQLGSSMRHLAGFDDEAAKSAANILLRFGAIKDEGTLKRVEGDAADLATTMGVMLPQAAQTLGQILQDPENAARKLRPIIGSLTDAQKESIKAFTDQGDAAGAQGVILKVLEERIGGAAKAYGDTLGGSLDKFHAQAKETKASLLEDLSGPAKTATDAATGLLEEVQNLPTPLRDLIGVTVAGGTALIGIAAPVAGLVQSFNAVKTARLLGSAATDKDTASTTANTVATTAETAATEAASTAAAEAAAGSLAEQAAAVQLIVSNEGLTFSEKEIAAARLEAGSAAAQQLVSNQALIASEEGLVAAEAAQAEELAAAETSRIAAEGAAAASSLEVLGGLAGVTAATVGLVGAVLLYGSSQEESLKVTADYTSALKDQSGALDQNVDKATAAAIGSKSIVQEAQKAGLNLADMSKAVRDGSTNFDKLRDSVEKVKIDPTAHGAESLTRALKEGGAESSQFGRDLLGLAQAGKLSADQILDLVSYTNQLSGQYKDQASAASATSAATDGLTDSTSGLLSEQEKTSLVDSMNESLKRQKDTLDGLKQGYDDALTAQNGLIDAQLGAQGSDLARRDAEARLAEAQSKLADAQGGTAADPQKIRDAQVAEEEGVKALAAAHAKGDAVAADAAQNRIDKAKEAANAASGAGADPAKVSQAQRDVERAQLDLTRATASQAKAQADLDKTNIISAGGTQNLSQYTQDYVGKLKDLDAQASGPTKDSLDGLITQLQTASGTYETKLNQTLSINGYILTAQEVQGLIDKGLGINPGDLTRQQQIDRGDYLGGGYPGAGPHTPRASGGYVGPGSLFRGAEQGWELLAHDGVYSAGSGGRVLSHIDAVNALSGAQGGSRGVVVNGGISLIGNRESVDLLIDRLTVMDYLG